jgi:DNA-binding NarL/FixJ family response regulator
MYCNQEVAAQQLEKIIEQARNGERQPRTAPLPQPAKRLRPEQIGEILIAWHDGLNVSAIARLTPWDQTTIRRNLRAAGIDTHTNPNPNPNPNPNHQEIIRLHREGKSTHDIAKDVGCSSSTAWMVVRDHKVTQAADTS